MRLNFNLRAMTPTNKPQLISAVIRWNNQRLVYSTNQKVCPKNWNAEKQRVKNVLDEPTKDKTNAFLSQFETIKDEFFAAKTKGKTMVEQKAILKTINVPEFKAYLDAIYAPKKAVVINEDRTLFGFIAAFIDGRKNHSSLSKTVVKYKQMQTHLTGFIKQNNRLLDFEHINLDFFDDFVKYLYAQNLSKNYTNKIIALLKAVLNEATEKGYNSNHAYKSRKFNVPTENVQNVYLSVSELDELLKLDLSGNARLERVRDLFLIGCWTGLRFSDFTNIKPENITKKNGFEQLEITTIKTGQSVVIPLTPVAKELFVKYGGRIPAALSNQKMNDYLKELGELVGFDERVMITSTKAGMRIDVPYKKWELITTHTARRSFATNAFKSGLPTLQIMRITGHNSESSFRKYIKVTNEENAILLSTHPFFNGGKSESPLKKVS